MLGRSIITILAVALNALMMLQLHAERIGQSVDIHPLDQLRRFILVFQRG